MTGSRLTLASLGRVELDITGIERILGSALPPAVLGSALSRRSAEFVSALQDEYERPWPGGTPEATSAGQTALDLSAPEVTMAPGELEMARFHMAVGMARLIVNSLTTSEVASAWGLSSRQVRSLALRGLVHGFHYKRSWRFPGWQFEKEVSSDQVASIVANLPGDAHPLSVDGFMHRPQPELTEGDEAPRSPLEWLQEGHDARLVADLAQGLQAAT
jgi:hypothetical protein